MTGARFTVVALNLQCASRDASQHLNSGRFANASSAVVMAARANWPCRARKPRLAPLFDGPAAPRKHRCTARKTSPQCLAVDAMS